MNPLRRMIITVTTFFALAGAISLALPRTIHAVAAALVRDVDNPARQPFRGTCQSSFPGGNGNPNCVLATVPAGQELVIQGATFDLLVKPGPGASVRCTLLVQQASPLNNFIYTFGAQDLGPALGYTDGTEEYTCVANSPMYADPGTTVYASFGRAFVTPDSWSLTVTMSGSTVSLP
jgi:hypothetical protein